MNLKERDIQLENWMNEFGGAVLGCAQSILKNTQDAQDVFQNTFIKAYLKSDGFSEKEHVKAWLLRVAKNESISKLRSGWKKRIILTDIPEGLTEIMPKESFVAEHVKKIPRKYRETLWLYYWAGYKTEEIAEMTGAAPATVRTRLKRARESLKPHIQRSIENEYE